MNFKEWIQNNKILYHRSRKDFENFQNDKSIFFKQTKKESLQMMNVGSFLYTCEVNLGNLFKPYQLYDSNTEPYISDDPNRLTQLGKEVYHLIENNKENFNLDEDDVFDAVLYANTGAYDIIENPVFLNWLKSKNYDSFVVTEYKEESIGVFDSNRIKIIKKEKI